MILTSLDRQILDRLAELIHRQDDMAKDLDAIENVLLKNKLLLHRIEERLTRTEHKLKGEE